MRWQWWNGISLSAGGMSHTNYWPSLGLELISPIVQHRAKCGAAVKTQRRLYHHISDSGQHEWTMVYRELIIIKTHITHGAFSGLETEAGKTFESCVYKLWKLFNAVLPCEQSYDPDFLSTCFCPKISAFIFSFGFNLDFGWEHIFPRKLHKTAWRLRAN